jgi:hypothetical protein
MDVFDLLSSDLGLKEGEVNGIQMHGLLRYVFVKFTSEEKCQLIADLVVGGVRWKKCKSVVKGWRCDSVSLSLRIVNVCPEVGMEDVAEVMEEYGKVLEIKRNVHDGWKSAADGTVSCRLEKKEGVVLPNFVRRRERMGEAADVWMIQYSGQGEVGCWKCGQFGHIGRFCGVGRKSGSYALAARPSQSGPSPREAEERKKMLDKEREEKRQVRIAFDKESAMIAKEKQQRELQEEELRLRVQEEENLQEQRVAEAESRRLGLEQEDSERMEDEEQSRLGEELQDGQRMEDEQQSKEDTPSRVMEVEVRNVEELLASVDLIETVSENDSAVEKVSKMPFFLLNSQLGESPVPAKGLEGQAGGSIVAAGGLEGQAEGKIMAAGRLEGQQESLGTGQQLSSQVESLEDLDVSRVSPESLGTSGLIAEAHGGVPPSNFKDVDSASTSEDEGYEMQNNKRRKELEAKNPPLEKKRQARSDDESRKNREKTQAKAIPLTEKVKKMPRMKVPEPIKN